MSAEQPVIKEPSLEMANLVIEDCLGRHNLGLRLETELEAAFASALASHQDYHRRWGTQMSSLVGQ